MVAFSLAPADLEDVMGVFGDFMINQQLKQNERIAELENAIRIFIHMPQGCTCPNNGGGDCEWCESAGIAKALLEEKP